jgi:S-DNA-T family DNA segregation ATPase FtsK/SpoIIIE
VIDFEKVKIRSSRQINMDEASSGQTAFDDDRNSFTDTPEQVNTVKPKTTGYSDILNMSVGENIKIHKEEPAAEPAKRPVAKLPEERDTPSSGMQDDVLNSQIQQNTAAAVAQAEHYELPPIELLNKGKPVSGDTSNELRETAVRLQQTLNTFGVKVTITDISQGPSVTRYELQPEQGVKVSKIVGLTDDIKLNLAATDIRIEAPIPGKAAIGIEVPNKENTMVALRDLLESKDFTDFQSNIAFAVGKDIAGKVVVADIAKMPHMLIAGSTGSGKSVCINTLIMSILYKAHPDDVKLIMIDPKVVELSVYNGIPHLLLDVVTDPKKASAALHWGVTEMEDRYKRLAEFNVRDLKEYNKKVEAMRAAGDENAPAKMPQIVIIVDELADLMMVAPGEVEESICRLAQLARAAGIHLVIATQRPSVDVITGLIKANMPSRVAFAVSSGVDSRTILDMNGAEKLLGKGDMLFYPQGYSKPARIQGAFVSDSEVSDVVDFLKNQRLGNNYAKDIEEKLSTMGSSSGSGGSDSSSSRDEYFEQAGRFIIDKDKASIGMLQRVLKVGFNRAARIMDQLCDYGVVGEEEGTKPRKVLMSMEQFEQLLEEI